ncbi:DUF1592 domain-containing protein [Planctomycetaceae bacterium SH139]
MVRFACWIAAMLAGVILTTTQLTVQTAVAQESGVPEPVAEQDIDQRGELALETLSNYCYDCHTGDSAEGGIRVDFFSADVKLDDQIELIEKIILALKDQQMPPADAEQPSQEARVRTVEWIEARLQDFDCGSVSRPGRVTMRRLNRAEYNNTIRDLTGLDLKLADDFPSDDVGNGFDNIGDVLSIPPILMEKYLDAANRVAREVTENPQSRKRVFPFTPADEKDQEAVVATAYQNARDFASRAFRRPLSDAEADRLLGLMRNAWEADASEAEIMQTTIAAVLASPFFIYRVEDDDATPAVDGVRPLNDFELASRLSYFIWSSMPDEQLFESARQGRLHTPQQLAEQAQRMLADPKSEALVENFAGQWLQLRDLKNLSPDPDQFAAFDDALRQSMRRETELLFSHLMRRNLSLLELLNADYTFVNQRLARHYGIEDIQGDDFQKVALNGRRKGVLMHASILMLTSNPTRTSPVKRGKWVMDNLLGEPPPPAPPDVPELDDAGEALGTLRQRMEQHRADPNCAICHTKMDALGFGLENFDVIGRWRDADGREAIDPSGELPGGKTFASPVELVQILAEEKKQEFIRCLTNKMLTFALGRGLGISDRCTVRSITEKLASDDYRFGTLVESIVTSPPFMFQELGN